MRVTVSPDERGLIEFTLAVVNADRPWVDPNSPYRPVVQKWLSAIAHHTTEYAAVQAEVHKHLRHDSLYWGYRATDAGVVRQVLLGSRNSPVGFVDDQQLHVLGGTPESDIVLGRHAISVSLIMDPERGLTHRLAQCGHCERFLLDFEGRPRAYCSPEHQKLYDAKMAAERMRRYRARRKEKEAKRRGKAARTR